MSGCHPNRYNQYGYLDLTLLNDYAEYANSLSEFLLNTITLDYVLRTSIRNFQAMTHEKDQNQTRCISLYKINLDTDFLAYRDKLKRLCATSKSTLYEIKTTRLAHPTWIVRFLPDFKRLLRIFTCHLHDLVKKISEIERFVLHVSDMQGEMIRYHAVAAALTTVKYNLLTLYQTIRSGGLTAMKSSFLFPLLTDSQRWLTYSFYQIEQILSAFPGSSHSRQTQSLIKREKTTKKLCITSVEMLNPSLKKALMLQKKK